MIPSGVDIGPYVYAMRQQEQVASRKVCNASEAPNTECPEDIDIRGNFDGLTRLLVLIQNRVGVLIVSAVWTLENNWHLFCSEPPNLHPKYI